MTKIQKTIINLKVKCNKKNKKNKMMQTGFEPSPFTW